VVVDALRALLFDVDGTLADTESAHMEAFNRAFQEYGLDWHWSRSLYRELLSVTGGKERIIHFITCYHPDFTPPEPLADFVAALHRCKSRHYVEQMVSGEIPLRQGVRRLLEEARDKGLRLAIATTTSPENVTALLEHALAPGSERWFEVIGAGDVVAAKKPAPDIYVHVMRQMGLSPRSCLALEDSAHGVRAARDAGIPATVVAVNDFTRDQDFSYAALVVDQLGEPDKPCHVLKGRQDVVLVDVEALRSIHESCQVRAQLTSTR
jgi:HAD superfamily hydrolase (TIGR01509 family)